MKSVSLPKYSRCGELVSGYNLVVPEQLLTLDVQFLLLTPQGSIISIHTPTSKF